MKLNTLLLTLAIIYLVAGLAFQETRIWQRDWKIRKLYETVSDYKHVTSSLGFDRYGWVGRDGKEIEGKW